MKILLSLKIIIEFIFKNSGNADARAVLPYKSERG